MVYVYAKQSEINKHLTKQLKVEEIKTTLKELGMDLKGETSEKDPELKIEITAEKLDMISAIGISRAISYYREEKTSLPKYKLEKSEFEVIVKKSAEFTRPKTVAAILKDVPMNEELLDEIIKIQEKIHASFGRQRKKAAIGIYPIDKIKFPVTYGSENPKDIKFQPLEEEKEMDGDEILEKHKTGKKFAHLLKNEEYFPVFRDNSAKILSMPPIINSEDIGKVETNHTDLFVEITGHNIKHLDNILKVLVTTFIEFGAKAQSIEVKYENNETYELNLDQREYTLSLDYVNKLIGIDLSQKEVEKLLQKMQYELVKIENDQITISIPCYKSDVWYDCDIADDIARGYGYNKIKPTFPQITSIGKLTKSTEFRENITDSIKSLGFIELYTYMLTSTKDQFDLLDKNEENHKFIKIVDSAEEGINMIRKKILPENLKSLHINRQHKYPQRVFECGFTIHHDETKETKSRDEMHLCVSIADPSSNFTQIKEVLDTINSLYSLDLKLKESEESFLIEGRRADIYYRDEKIGFIGEIAPHTLENFGLIVPISTLEINLEKFIENY